MKKSLIAADVAVAFLAAGCASVTTPVGIGGLYTDVTSGEAVTSNSIGKKVGYSNATNILGLVATGDASIEAAAKQGGIRKVSHVDSKKTSVLGLYSTYKVFVYGE